MRRSPFSIFRDNAKFLMVILIALAMFAFIIMDQLNPDNFPYVLGFLAGAGLFWLIGQKLGKPLLWAAAGAVLGLAATMIFVTGTSSRDTVVSTTAGDLTFRDLQRLGDERRLVNGFLSQAYYISAMKPGPQDEFLEQMLEPEQFRRYKHEMASQNAASVMIAYTAHPFEMTDAQMRQDLVFGWLLRHEAEQMGIRISDAAINAHVSRITNDRLTEEDFRGIVSRLGADQNALYDALRDELAAQRAWELTLPAAVATPRDYWENYQKLNTLATLEVAAVPVESFTDEIPMPTDEKLAEFFEQHKLLVPNQAGPGEPGFFQHRNIRLAYLQADLSDFEKSIDEPTDAEADQYYHDDIDRYRIRPLLDDFGFGDVFDREFGDRPDDDRPLDPSFTPEAEDERGTPATAPRTAPPTPPALDEPPASETSPAPRPERDRPTAPETPAAPLPAPVDEAPSDEAPGSDEGAEPDDAASDETPDGSSARFDGNPLRDAAALQFVAQQEPVDADDADDEPDAPADDATDAAPPLGDAAPATPAPATPAPAATEPATPASAAEPSDAAPAATEPKTEPPTSADEPPLTPETAFPDGPELPAPAPRGPPEPPPLPRYRQLDDKLRAEIRDQIRQDRAAEEMRRRIEEAANRLEELSGNYLNTLDPESRPTRGQLDARLKEIGESLGLTHVETPLLDEREFSESEEYAIARETVADPDVPRAPDARVSAALASAFDPGMLIYQPKEAVDAANGRWFVYWKTAHAEAHVPLWAPYTPAPEMKLGELNQQLGEGAFPTLYETSSIAEFIIRENGGTVPSTGATIEWNQYRLVVEEANGDEIRRVRIEEPGIREQVERGWKMQQARPKAEARARELADAARDAVRSADGPLAESLAAQTVTGKADGPPLSIEETNSFSWYRLSSVPSQSMGTTEYPVRSEIPSVPDAGDEFMRTVFDDLAAGDVGVAPDADHGVYYVVRVVRKIPEAPLGDEKFRERFLNEDELSPLRILARERRQALVNDWHQQLQERYRVTWSDRDRR
ncbi:MAG: transporter associated domain-containing protein [Planctomycetaceae bacterium]